MGQSIYNSLFPILSLTWNCAFFRHGTFCFFCWVEKIKWKNCVLNPLLPNRSIPRAFPQHGLAWDISNKALGFLLMGSNGLIKHWPSVVKGCLWKAAHDALWSSFVKNQYLLLSFERNQANAGHIVHALLYGWTRECWALLSMSDNVCTSCYVSLKLFIKTKKLE